MKFKLSFESLEAKALLAIYLDTAIDQFMTTAYSDNFLSRNEAITVFNTAGDLNAVDANELTDLKVISSKLNMDAGVKGLCQNILSSPANKGKNLVAGSSTAELTRLVDKWMFGKDRPKIPSNTQYRSVAGSLFVSGASSLDVRQGNVGDCYLLATMAALADKSNASLYQMFTDNKDNTWTVTFYRLDGSRILKDYVVVDRFLPVYSNSDTPVFASFGTSSTNARNELWVSLAEKAYAQWNETGYTKRSNTTNSYAAISGGFAHYPMFNFTGQHSTYSYDILNAQTALINAINSGKPIVIYRYMDAQKTTGHAYFLKSYANGKFELVNPWGYANLSFTWTDIRRECYGYAVAQQSTPTSTPPLAKAVVAKAFAALNPV
jgi:hypothetical protein